MCLLYIIELITQENKILIFVTFTTIDLLEFLWLANI